MATSSENPSTAHHPVPTRRPFAQRVRVDQAGRVVVPAGIRKALGIHSGHNLTISLEGDSIRLQTIDAALERVRAIARRKRRLGSNVVDDFIAERRAEAAAD